MLVLLSPSKTLDETPMTREVSASQPALLEHTKQLHAILKGYSAARIQTLMKVSDKIAALNAERFAKYQPEGKSSRAKPALFIFKGDVYDPIPVAEYDDAMLDYANQHIRILSGFYGLLRPLDAMQPYRLEMGTRLANERGKNLYDFWGEHITQAINVAAQETSADIVLNLASEEYFKAVDSRLLTPGLVQVQFRDYKAGQYKIIGIYAKKARGMMTDYLVQARAKTLEDVKRFNVAGYQFEPDMSDAGTLTFIRRQASAA